MFIILEIKIQVLCIKTQITFGTLNKQLHLCCQFHSHPCCSCCAAVDCSFCLLSTLGFLWRANICSLRVIKTVVCGALSSLLFSWRLALSLFIDCSKTGYVILGTLANEKPAVTALVWQIKVPFYCRRRLCQSKELQSRWFCCCVCHCCCDTG